MLAARTRRQSAERLRTYLKKARLIDKNHKVFGKNSFIYFPILRTPSRAEAAGMSRMGASVSGARFEMQQGRASYREELMGSMGRDKYDRLAKSYDALGSIAVVEASPADAKGIARAILRTNSSIRTVLRKGGAIRGRYRTRKFIFVAGERNYVAEYRENNALFRFDVRKAFFSPRLSYERGRIAALSRNGENVVVMFAGVGPFAIEIAKRNRRSMVIAMELNRQAYLYMLQNIALNRTSNVVAELGDVGKLAARHKGFADRIVMPLPKDSFSFLDAVAACARDGCVVHYYAFGGRETAFEDRISEIREFFAARKLRMRVLSERVVRPYSASEIEVVIDFRIGKPAGWPQRHHPAS